MMGRAPPWAMWLRRKRAEPAEAKEAKERAFLSAILDISEAVRTLTAEVERLRVVIGTDRVARQADYRPCRSWAVTDEDEVRIDEERQDALTG